VGFAELRVDTGPRPAGAQVWALLRPEYLQPDPPPGTHNRIPGQAGAQRYLGAVVRYDFHPQGQAQGTQPLLAEARTAAREAVAIAPEHIRLLDS